MKAIFKKRKRWLALIVLLGVFTLIAANLSQMEPFDTAVYNAVHRLYSPAATVFFKAVTAFSSPAALIIISAVLMFALRRSRYYWVPVLANMAICILLNLSLKSVFIRARPDEALRLVTESGYSFPSGHAMASMAFYGFIINLLHRSGLSAKWKGAGYVCLPLLILLIGVSRIYLGVHFASDVLAGFCVSLGYLIVFTSFVSTYFEHELSIASLVPNNQNRRLIMSFAHALDGILAGLKKEPNMIIHFGVMVLVIVFGVIFAISPTEWCVCVLLFGAVMGAELLNTAIETTVNICMPKVDPRAKLAKDTAAGAVLVIAISAMVIGLIIFAPKIWTLFS